MSPNQHIDEVPFPVIAFYGLMIVCFVILVCAGIGVLISKICKSCGISYYDSSAYGPASSLGHNRTSAAVHLARANAYAAQLQAQRNRELERFAVAQRIQSTSQLPKREVVIIVPREEPQEYFAGCLFDVD